MDPLEFEFQVLGSELSPLEEFSVTGPPFSPPDDILQWPLSSVMVPLLKEKTKGNREGGPMKMEVEAGMVLPKGKRCWEPKGTDETGGYLP